METIILGYVGLRVSGLGRLEVYAALRIPINSEL